MDGQTDRIPISVVKKAATESAVPTSVECPIVTIGLSCLVFEI